MAQLSKSISYSHQHWESLVVVELGTPHEEFYSQQLSSCSRVTSWASCAWRPRTRAPASASHRQVVPTPVCVSTPPTVPPALCSHAFRFCCFVFNVGGCWWPKLGPHAYGSSTQPTEPSSLAHHQQIEFLVFSHFHLVLRFLFHLTVQSWGNRMVTIIPRLVGRKCVKVYYYA